MSETQASRLSSLAGVMFKLGCTAFGGPAAHIAMLEREVVERRAWLTREAFLDLLASANLVPGPNSTELVMHVGLRRCGLPGLLVAGACFIGPAFAIVLACAWFYVEYGALPEVQGVLYAVKPVVLAIVCQAIVRLAGTGLRSPLSITLGSVALLAAAMGVHELIVLFGAGLIGILVTRSASNELSCVAPILPFVWTGAAGAVAAPFSMNGLFLVFLKVGGLLYGSGYVLLAFLRSDLVERLGWLREAQLIDAVAIGQVTPGPLFTTATFVGYVLGGTWGAIVATIAIFLPAFVFVGATAPWIEALRASPRARGFLDGVVAASLALMAVVTVQLLQDALVDGVTIALGVAATILLLTLRLNSIWLVLGAALVGILLRT